MCLPHHDVSTQDPYELRLTICTHCFLVPQNPASTVSCRVRMGQIIPVCGVSLGYKKILGFGFSKKTSAARVPFRTPTICRMMHPQDKMDGDWVAQCPRSRWGQTRNGKRHALKQSAHRNLSPSWTSATGLIVSCPTHDRLLGSFLLQCGSSSVSFRAVAFLLPAMVSFHSIYESRALGRY